jgi:hypothetical protein
MRRHATIRLVAASALAAVAVPVTLAVAAPVASASGTTQITCLKLSGNITNQALKSCSGPSAIVGTKAGKGVATTVTGATTNVTTWGKGGAGGTSTSTFVDSIGGTACGTKAIEVTVTSTVVSGTGAAAALVGDVGNSVICYNSAKGTVSLLKGTVYTQ